jgi:hypothetical protein
MIKVTYKGKEYQLTVATYIDGNLALELRDFETFERA